MILAYQFGVQILQRFYYDLSLRAVSFTTSSRDMCFLCYHSTLPAAELLLPVGLITHTSQCTCPILANVCSS